MVEKEFEGDSACWMVSSKDHKEAIIGYFNGIQSTHPKETILKGNNFNEGKKYTVEVFNQPHSIHKFGNLVNLVLPIHVNCDGFLIRTYAKHATMPMEKENYEIDGSILNKGLLLNCEWAGNGYNENVRVLGDFGCRLYLIKQID